MILKSYKRNTSSVCAFLIDRADFIKNGCGHVACAVCWKCGLTSPSIASSLSSVPSLPPYLILYAMLATDMLAIVSAIEIQIDLLTRPNGRLPWLLDDRAMVLREPLKPRGGGLFLYCTMGGKMANWVLLRRANLLNIPSPQEIFLTVTWPPYGLARSLCPCRFPVAYHFLPPSLFYNSLPFS